MESFRIVDSLWVPEASAHYPPLLLRDLCLHDNLSVAGSNPRKKAQANEDTPWKIFEKDII